MAVLINKRGSANTKPSINALPKVTNRMSTATSPRSSKLTALDLLCSLLSPKDRTISIPSGQTKTDDLHIDLTNKTTSNGAFRKSSTWVNSREKSLTKSSRHHEVYSSKTSSHKDNARCPPEAIFTINSRTSSLQKPLHNENPPVKESMEKLAKSKSLVKIFSVQQKLSILKRNRLIKRISQTHNRENEDSNHQQTNSRCSAKHDFSLVPIKHEIPGNKSMTKQSQLDSSKSAKRSLKSSKSSYSPRHTSRDISATDREYTKKSYESLTRNGYCIGAREQTTSSLKRNGKIKLLGRNLALHGVPVLPVRDSSYQLPCKSSELPVHNNSSTSRSDSVLGVPLCYTRPYYRAGKSNSVDYFVKLPYARDLSMGSSTLKRLGVNDINTHDDQSTVSSSNTSGHLKFNYKDDKSSVGSRPIHRTDSITEMKILNSRRCDKSSTNSGTTSFPEIPHSETNSKAYLKIVAKNCNNTEHKCNNPTDPTTRYNNQIVGGTYQRSDEFKREVKQPMTHPDEPYQYKDANSPQRLQPPITNDAKQKALVVSESQKGSASEIKDSSGKEDENLDDSQNIDHSVKDENVRVELLDTGSVVEESGVTSESFSPNILTRERLSPSSTTIVADASKDEPLTIADDIAKDCDSIDSYSTDDTGEDRAQTPKFYGSTSLLSDLNISTGREDNDETATYKTLRAIDQGTYSDFAHRKYRKKHSEIKPKEGKSIHYLKVKMKDK